MEHERVAADNWVKLTEYKLDKYIYVHYNQISVVWMILGYVLLQKLYSMNVECFLLLPVLLPLIPLLFLDYILLLHCTAGLTDTKHTLAQL